MRSTAPFTLLCAAVLAALPGVARADVFPVSLSTGGTFAATGLDTYLDLTYGGTSDVRLVNGGSLILSNIGLFKLNRPPSGTDVYDTTFMEVIQFTIPSGTDPNPAIFDASVMGTVKRIGGGTVDIAFDPAGQLLTFSNSFAVGSFLLTLDDVQISVPGLNMRGTGTISNFTFTAVPEPAGIVLLSLATGLTLIAVRRKRTEINTSR